jgi:opacity protein-like surface antigen
MNNILKLMLLTLPTCLSSLPKVAMAGAMGAKNTSPSIMKNIYLGVDGGYSMSLNSTNLSPYDTSNIAASSQIISVPGNTTFQNGIDDSGMIGAFLGYRVNNSLSFNLNYDYRGWFSWQVPTNAVLSSGINDLIYSAKNIKIQTLFVNFVINPNKNWEGWGNLTPYVSGGLGAAFNQLGTLSGTDLIDPNIYSNIAGASSTSFAWNVGLGVDYALSKNISYSLGYRFVNAGTVQSSEQLSSPMGVFSVNPFKANHVLLNEVITGIKWQFDA